MKPIELNLTPLKPFTVYFIISAICLTFRTYGQIEQPVRIELDRKSGDNLWNVVSAHEFGVVLFREDGSGDNNNRKWQVKMLDTSLKLIWDKEYPIDKKYQFKGYDYSNNQLLLLFQEGQYSNGNYHVVRIFLSNGAFKAYEIANDVSLDLQEFMAAGESVVFGGYANNLPAVLLYNFEQGKLKVIPGLYERNSYILDLTSDDVTNTFSLVLSERINQNNSLVLKDFDNSGEIITDKKIEIKENTNILSAKSTMFDWGEQVITGTFGEKNSDLAKGVYFLKFQEDTEPVLKTYNFSELSNYFNYLTPSQKEKIDRKIKQKKSRGKEFNVRSRIILHELIPEGNEYIMLGESYEVNYTNAFSSPYGTPYWMNSFNSGNRGYRITFPDKDNFDRPVSFEYQQAIIVGFSREGDLKWDNSLVLHNLQASYLYQVVHVNTVNNRLVLIYREGDKLLSKVVKDEEAQSSETSIELKYTGDILKGERAEYTGLSYWYEDNFYTWGYQRIKNNTSTEIPRTRDVFYINKVSIK